jgi:class 3 adenylate cyclase
MINSVVVFDICSSSVILEDLQQSGSQARYAQLMDAVSAYLHQESKSRNFQIYKFLGDGFILLFPEQHSADDLLLFLIYLTFYCNVVIETFRRKNLDIAELPRRGITIGVAQGQVYGLQSANIAGIEYFGRPINLASRFQSSLDRPEHANTLLVSREFFNSLNTKATKEHFNETTRKLRNMSGGKAVRCFYLDLKQHLPEGTLRWNSKVQHLAKKLIDPTLVDNSELSNTESFASAQTIIQTIENPNAAPNE